MARSDDRELEPLAPLDPMQAPPEAFAPLRDEEPAGAALAPEEHPRVARRRSRLRRVLIFATIGVVALVGAGVLAQNLLDGRAARHAAATFSSFQRTDYALGQQTAAINSRMVPDDQPRVDPVLTRAERDEIAQGARALRTLHEPFWLDGSTRRVIGTVRAALTARLADLHALVAWRRQPGQSRGVQPADPSAKAKALLDRAAVTAAAHLPAEAQVAPAAPDDLMSSLGLSSFTDKPTGSTLAVANAGGVALVDVDASSSVDLNLAGTAQTVVGRDGYVAAITRDGVAYAKPPVGDAPTTWLGPAQELLPAAQPYAVWRVTSVRERRFASRTTLLAEVDGTGQRIFGPVAVPSGQYLTGGVTKGGLVLSAGAQGLVLWDVRTGHETPLAPAGATLLAAAPDAIAWQGDSGSVVNVTDLRTGTTRPVILPADDTIVADLDVTSTTCAFSPDQSQLACPLLSMRSLPGAPFHIGVIDVDEGNARELSGAASTSDAHPIVWSPDGARVWSVVATDEGSLLATWGVGQPSAREVRYRVGNWLVGLAVLEQRPASALAAP
ncbi:MAG TPA: hypothetical protein VMU14_13525 [Acidimicrobiales bacterium]|nr:hypothetical protein [Acidimicrobiales bacterium]